MEFDLLEHITLSSTKNLINFFCIGSKISYLPKYNEKKKATETSLDQSVVRWDYTLMNDRFIYSMKKKILCTLSVILGDITSLEKKHCTSLAESHHSESPCQ